MRVLIYGVNSTNKGAQLLLAAAAQRVRHLGHEPVVSVRDVSRQSRIEYNAMGMFSIEKLGPLRSGGLDRLPASLNSRIGIVGDSQFDYVLDASGYSLTDAWGMAPVHSRLSRMKRWSTRKIGYAFLPQAFGPFENPDVAAGVKSIVRGSDVVWARDPVSRNYLLPLIGVERCMEVAPDITIALHAEAPRPEAVGHVVLVPNWNLATRTGPPEGYVESLAKIAQAIVSGGQPVLGMSHEGPRDLELIREVAARVPSMKVISPESGVEAKKILAGAELVIAGRYHALVSALSSGVPAIAHSWSHKYSALMDDFGVSDGLADPRDPAATLALYELLDLSAERRRLRARLPLVEERLERVWARVESLLTSR